MPNRILEITTKNRLKTTIRYLDKLLKEDEKAWTTIVTQDTPRNRKQLRDAKFRLIRTQRKPKIIIAIKVGKEGKIKDIEEIARRRECLVKWRKKNRNSWNGI